MGTCRYDMPWLNVNDLYISLRPKTSTKGRPKCWLWHSRIANSLDTDTLLTPKTLGGHHMNCRVEHIYEFRMISGRTAVTYRHSIHHRLVFVTQGWEL